MADLVSLLVRGLNFLYDFDRLDQISNIASRHLVLLRLKICLSDFCAGCLASSSSYRVEVRRRFAKLGQILHVLLQLVNYSFIFRLLNGYDTISLGRLGDRFHCIVPATFQSFQAASNDIIILFPCNSYGDTILG